MEFEDAEDGLEISMVREARFGREDRIGMLALPDGSIFAFLDGADIVTANVPVRLTVGICFLSIKGFLCLIHYLIPIWNFQIIFY